MSVRSGGVTGGTEVSATDGNGRAPLLTHPGVCPAASDPDSAWPNVAPGCGHFGSSRVLPVRGLHGLAAALAEARSARGRTDTPLGSELVRHPVRPRVTGQGRHPVLPQSLGRKACASAEASDLPAQRTLRGVRSPESGSPELVSQWRGHVTPLVAPGPPCNVGLQAQQSQDPSGPTFHSSSSVTTGCCHLPRPPWGPLSSLFGANS